jgi:hypothetical protein
VKLLDFHVDSSNINIVWDKSNTSTTLQDLQAINLWPNSFSQIDCITVSMTYFEHAIQNILCKLYTCIQNLWINIMPPFFLGKKEHINGCPHISLVYHNELSWVCSSAETTAWPWVLWELKAGDLEKWKSVRLSGLLIPDTHVPSSCLPSICYK